MSNELELFRQDAYLQQCEARIERVKQLPDGAVALELDRTVFYPLGGGQAGDAGWITLPDGQDIAIVDTRKAKDEAGALTGQVWHVLSSQIGKEPAESMRETLSKLEHLAVAGDKVQARIDWPRRHRLMRFHTATHLLCHIVPQLVNGCSITPDYARLDFSMTEPLDKDRLTQELAKLVQAAYPVHVSSITDEELDANPSLVKSMSVSPPRGTGSVRVIRIGQEQLIDLQPCGGTHVANTAEIGSVLVTKIEKKSATTRRVVLGFA